MHFQNDFRCEQLKLGFRPSSIKPAAQFEPARCESVSPVCHLYAGHLLFSSIGRCGRSHISPLGATASSATPSTKYTSFPVVEQSPSSFLLPTFEPWNKRCGDVLQMRTVVKMTTTSFCKMKVMMNSFTFHLLPCPSCSSGQVFCISSSRNTKSKGRWNEEMGMAEVFEKNGKMWVTTGIVRKGKTYTSIEETLYLMELGALDLLDNGDRSISLIEMYEKVAGEKSGCCWELFEAYRHLKSLGYIIGRHGVAWSLKSIRSSLKSTASEGTEDSKQFVDMVSNVELSINKLFSDLKINDLNPDFDVYLPNNRFRKSSPGDPDFLLYLSRGHLPSRAEIEALERQCGRIPLKICLVTEGKVSFFSFDKVELPVLP